MSIFAHFLLVFYLVPVSSQYTQGSCICLISERCKYPIKVLGTRTSREKICKIHNENMQAKVKSMQTEHTQAVQDLKHKNRIGFCFLCKQHNRQTNFCTHFFAHASSCCWELGFRPEGSMNFKNIFAMNRVSSSIFRPKCKIS